jgi:formylglycine-generating enzyme
VTRHLLKTCGTCGLPGDEHNPGPCSVCWGEHWQYRCSRHKCEADSGGCTQCAYTFLGQHFHTPAALAVALADAWDTAVSHVASRPLHEWIRDTFDDRALDTQLKKCFRSSKLNPDHKLAISLLLLDSSRPLVWRGDRVTADWLLANPTHAELIVSGELPIWLQQLRREEWLVSLHAHWLEFWSRAGTNADLFDRTAALQLLLGPNGTLRAAVSKRLEEYSESTVDIIQRLFEKTTIDEIDSAMLASCSLKCLRSRVEVQSRLVKHYSDSISALIADGIPKQTTLNGLEQCRLRFDAGCECHRTELSRLAGPNAEFLVESSIAELEAKAAAALGDRFASHERQRLLRDRLLQLATSGDICEAEALAGKWKTEFTDLELGIFYQLRRRWRWLVQVNRLAWGTVALVVIFSVVMKWTQMRASKPFEVNLAEGVSLRFIPLPLGAFDIGSSTNDHDSESSERPVTTVRLTQRYWLTETEITQAQWEVLMATDVEQQRRKHKVEGELVKKGATLPIVFVSWSEAEEFCRKVALRLPRGGTVRLPTEAEWEIACRAGANARLFPSSRLATSGGNFSPSAPGAHGRAMPVKQFPPNKWGFYDMHGNVGEWCRGEAVFYPGGEVENWNAITTERERSYRGGSWKQPMQLARASARNWRPGGSPAAHVGFRVLWDPSAPPSGG